MATHNDDSPARRLRIFLRDHRVLDARADVPEGQFLASYLASRNRYVNLTEVDWVGLSEHGRHLALKVDTILWAASEDGDLPLTTPVAAATDRRVELELESGYLLRAGLLLLPEQRLTDYLQAAPAFVPLQQARLMPRGKKLGDVVVNQHAIKVVRELVDGDGESGPRARMAARAQEPVSTHAPAPGR